jgi:hypothetical protein
MAFYSTLEAKKPRRVYHDNSACAAGREISRGERRSGTANYRHCENCEILDRQER